MALERSRDPNDPPLFRKSSNCDEKEVMPVSATVGLRHSEISNFIALDSNAIVLVFPLPAGPFSTSSLCNRMSALSRSLYTQSRITHTSVASLQYGIQPILDI